MSYRPDDQALDYPIEKMLEGIADFNEAVRARLQSDEWTEEHLNRINRIRKELSDFEIQLIQLRKETW